LTLPLYVDHNRITHHAFSARRTRSGFIGVSWMRVPVAVALAMAAGAGMMLGSPTPRAVIQFAGC
jgi:hypothetical protein